MSTQSDKIQYLTEHEFFRDFAREEIKRMEKQTTMFTCAPGRLFYSAGEAGEILFILKEGSVHLYRLTPEGRKLIVATLDKGAVFGEMSLVGTGMHNTFAEAATPARICVMSRVDVESLLAKKPQMALRLLNMVSGRLRQAETQLEQMAFNSVPSRLADLLIRLAKEENAVQGFTHQDLAEMIGTYRETATSILNEWKSEGVVSIGRKRIDVLDRDALLAITEQNGA